MRCFVLLGVLFLVGSTLINAREAKKDKEAAKTPNYYPLQVDNVWHYKHSVDDSKAEVVWRVVKIDDFNAEKLPRLEMTHNGNVIAVEHWRQTAEGIFRHRFNGVELTPPICFLKYPIQPDAKWDGEVTVGTKKGKYAIETKEEAVDVAAGKFKTIRVKVRIEENGKVAHTTYWFAPDVGMVKQSIEASDTNIVMELGKFEPAKEKK
jgi:hypothetical protein